MNFDQRNFTHKGTYNAELGRMESWLISTIDQDVTSLVIQESFHFSAGERMLVEISTKYTIEQINSLAHRNGFEPIQNFFDRQKYFAVSVWKV